jgi:predicted PurR-regulated permease PerM/CheY-like chemotaxis protein
MSTQPSTVQLPRPLIVLASLVLVAACLYWAQAVLIPVALALLLTFLLSPVVGALQRRRLGRVPSVLLVVVLVFSLLGGAGWALTHQLTVLAHELPQYRSNLRHRIADLRGVGKGSAVEKVQQTVKDMVGELHRDDQQAVGGNPMSVVVESPSLFTAQIPSALDALGTAGLVIVLVIFMLIERQELRNRLVRLIGYRQLTLTTQALDEAGQRISQYLLMQSIINGTFGLAVGVGLFLIGVPYAVLWGAVAAALRFIPYIGPWMAALLPAALSLAVFPGWGRPILVVGLFLALELFSNLVMETWLYGRSAGVSNVALLVAVASWTWLWGPLGLMLATPLTVCLIVLSKYLPGMEFLAVLLSDEPGLSTQVRYYQRLLGRDQDEATAIVEEHVCAHGRERVYDEVLVPALHYARRDRERDRLPEDGAQFVVRVTREIVADLDPLPPISPDAADSPGSEVCSTEKVRIIGCPVRGETDALGLEMLRQLLEPTGCEIEMIGAGISAAEMVERVRQHRLALICLATITPGGLAQSRHLCKRLRVHFPDLQIVFGRWGPNEHLDEDRKSLLAAGADHVGSTILETQAQVIPLLARPMATSPVGRTRLEGRAA